MYSNHVFAFHSTSFVASDSAVSGLNGWNLPSDSAMEYLGISSSNSTFTGFRYAYTYIPEPDLYFQNSTANMLKNLDSISQPGAASQFQAAATNVFTTNTNEFTSSVYGTLSIKNLTGATTTVCVYNCGVLPWTFSRTYAANTGNSTAVNVPYQRFSMLFSGIDTYNFQTNNHVSFNRDTFQLR